MDGVDKSIQAFSMLGILKSQGRDPKQDSKDGQDLKNEDRGRKMT